VAQESLITRVMEWLDEVYTGATTVEPQYRFTSLAHHPGAADISREDFAYYTSLVRHSFHPSRTGRRHYTLIQSVTTFLDNF
jgi:hypothetical protein